MTPTDDDHAGEERGANRPTAMRTHLCGVLRRADVGTKVRLCGWVARRREHGEHLAFVDLRDHSGIVQCVIDHATDVRHEWVVAVTGTVRERPEGTVNPGIGTGEIEIGDCTVEVLNEAEPPPFSVDDRAEADEPVRLRYRYVDLRRPRMQRNLRLRSRVNAAIRAAMERQGFAEIETPLLWAPTPEGSREFSVPARLHHGSFYALPQSPQLAKQLLMVGGFDRYFQIARCLRDEDLRADRQFEFSQLDMECSFASQDDVMAFVSEAVLDAAEAATGERPPPIERMTWADALDRYGTDKPDLRFGDGAGRPDRGLRGDPGEGLLLPDGQGAGGARGRRSSPAPGSTSSPSRPRGRAPRAWPGSGWSTVRRPRWTARSYGTSRSTKWCASWHRRRRQRGTSSWPSPTSTRPRARCSARCAAPSGRPRSARAPIDTSGSSTSPCSRASAPTAIRSRPTTRSPCRMRRTCRSCSTDPLSVRSQAYDLVLNGWELGSGSVRIHRGDIQSQVFSALGIAPAEAEARFGFLLGAFRYGAPPHAGFAFGIDRLAAILAGEENIREVIAYPKTQSGADLLTGAPTPLPPAALAELGIRVVVPPPGSSGQPGEAANPSPS